MFKLKHADCCVICEIVTTSVVYVNPFMSKYFMVSDHFIKVYRYKKFCAAFDGVVVVIEGEPIVHDRFFVLKKTRSNRKCGKHH